MIVVYCIIKYMDYQICVSNSKADAIACDEISFRSDRMKLPRNFYCAAENLQSDEVLLVAKNRSEIYGFCIFRPLKAYEEIYVTHITVDKDYRRLGVAKELINYLIEHGQGFNKITAYVTSNNEASHKLHKSMGFDYNGCFYVKDIEFAGTKNLNESVTKDIISAYAEKKQLRLYQDCEQY